MGGLQYLHFEKKQYIKTYRNKNTKPFYAQKRYCMMNRNKIVLIVLICTIQLNILSAMRPTPVPKFIVVSDHRMDTFTKKHKTLAYYPLLSEGTSFSLIVFNKKFDSILHQNIAELRSKKYKESIIEDYKAEVFDKHFVNLKKITTYAMKKDLPVTTVSIREELTECGLPPFNNICLYYYPVPSKHHTLDKNTYTHVYKSALKLNKKIAQERGVAEGNLVRYEEKALHKLYSIHLEHFSNPIHSLPNTFVYTNYKSEPLFNLVYSNSDLENFAGNQNPYCIFPMPNAQSMVNLEYYISAYYTVLHKSLQQMRYLGVPEAAVQQYQYTLTVYLKQIIATYCQQLL